MSGSGAGSSRYLGDERPASCAVTAVPRAQCLGESGVSQPPPAPRGGEVCPGKNREIPGIAVIADTADIGKAKNFNHKGHEGAQRDRRNRRDRRHRASSGKAKTNHEAKNFNHKGREGRKGAAFGVGSSAKHNNTG